MTSEPFSERRRQSHRLSPSSLLKATAALIEWLLRGWRPKRSGAIQRSLAALNLAACLIVLEAGVLAAIAIPWLAPWVAPCFAATYLPRAAWLLLLVPPAALGALVAPRQVLLLAVAAFAWLLWAMDYNLGLRRHPGDSDLVLLQANMGQRHGYDYRPYFNEQAPDLLVLQEHYGGPERLTMRLADHRSRQMGGLLLLSRLPILSAEPVELGGDPRLSPHAARYELDYGGGRRLVCYNVHMLSPRPLLAPLRGRGVLRLSAWRRLQASLAERREMYRRLAASVGREQLPTVVAGDMNTPDNGWFYWTLRRGLLDAHEAAGTGFGYTFPGGADSVLLRWLAPWLRLDQVFLGPGLAATFCRVDSQAHSQHLAQTVGLRLPQVIAEAKGGQ